MRAVGGPIVVHVTPELAPTLGGVAGYVSILSNELSYVGFAQTYLLVQNYSPFNNRHVRPLATAARVVSMPQQLANDVHRIGATAVILHYSGYGFAQRGAPVHLVRALSEVRRQCKRLSLIAVFHETWADSGRVWESSFWLKPVQRWCAASLVRDADVVITSNSLYRKSLKSLTDIKTPVVVWPVFSNVGELEGPNPFEEREPACIVFGRPHSRSKVHSRFLKYWTQLCDLGVKRLVEIGPEPEKTSGLRWPIPVERLGPLPPSEISRLLSSVRYGLFGCRPEMAGRSSVLAAFAAHGVAPVHPDGTGTFDGLAFGFATISLGDEGSRTHHRAHPRHAAMRAHNWYAGHSVRRQVEGLWLPILANV